jgi:hypothetical protein
MSRVIAERVEARPESESRANMRRIPLEAV